MKEPNTLEEWFEIFAGEEMPKKGSDLSGYRGGSWADDLFLMREGKMPRLWISDHAHTEATGWARKLIVWLNKTYEGEYTSAGTAWFIDQPTAAKVLAGTLIETFKKLGGKFPACWYSN